MKLGNFEVTCKKCGSKNVQIYDYRNHHSEGVRIKCKDCGATTEI